MWQGAECMWERVRLCFTLYSTRFTCCVYAALADTCRIYWNALQARLCFEARGSVCMRGNRIETSVHACTSLEYVDDVRYGLSWQTAAEPL